MKKILGLLVIMQSLSLQAQNITGFVFTAKEKSPVSYASVALLQMPDSNLVTGVITLMNGRYHIGKVNPGDYFIQANFLGIILKV
jgi:hypothetical protein